MTIMRRRPRSRPFWSKQRGDGRGVWRHYGFDLELRRSEPGCPAGWYLFGPGLDGWVVGDVTVDAAKRIARQKIMSLPRIER